MSILHKIPRNYKFWRYPLLLKLRYGLLAICSGNTMRIKYWINSRIFAWTPTIPSYNWGDYVNKPLAEFISGKKVLPFEFNQGPSAAMVGSILPWAMDKNTIVWGSGCLDSKSELWKCVEKPKEVCAVRGPLTRNVLLEHGIDCPEIYGDPVLLFPRYYQPQESGKKYKCGVIFHVSSFDEAKKWIDENKTEDILWINPAKFSDWREFIDQICSCEVILSSSLHGVIVADAYKIPNIWVSLTEKEHPDGNFKFKDYYLSVGKNIDKPIHINQINVGMMAEVKAKWVEPKIDLDKLVTSCPFIQ